MERDDLWFQTASGRIIHPMKMTMEDVHIPDIAHALAHTCRFGGHAKVFYSIAQHSIHVSRLVPSRFAMAALFHDAAKAYLGDMVRPLKMLPLLAGYRDIEYVIGCIIENALQLNRDSIHAVEIKNADHKALATETRDLIANPKAGYWTQVIPDTSPIIPASSAHDAKQMFLRRYEELSVYQRQQSLF